MSAEELNTYEDHDEELASIDGDDDHGPVHNDTEGVWLISYADLMTLLMGFFALMLSMSTFDETKFTAMGEGVAERVGGEIVQPYEEVGETIKNIIKEKGRDDQVQVEVKKTQLTVTFEGTLLFSSGSFGLKTDANELMKDIAGILGSEVGDKKILVEGHTDNMPINKGIIASNWELSSLRANSVARLFEAKGFSKNQILTIGLGETRPVVNNEDSSGIALPDNQAKNRRVVIKVMNDHPL